MRFSLLIVTSFSSISRYSVLFLSRNFIPHRDSVSRVRRYCAAEFVSIGPDYSISFPLCGLLRNAWALLLALQKGPNTIPLHQNMSRSRGAWDGRRWQYIVILLDGPEQVSIRRILFITVDSGAVVRLAHEVNAIEDSMVARRANTREEIRLPD